MAMLKKLSRKNLTELGWPRIRTVELGLMERLKKQKLMKLIRIRSLSLGKGLEKNREKPLHRTWRICSTILRQRIVIPPLHSFIWSSWPRTSIELSKSSRLLKPTFLQAWMKHILTRILKLSCKIHNCWSIIISSCRALCWPYLRNWVSSSFMILDFIVSIRWRIWWSQDEKWKTRWSTFLRSRWSTRWNNKTPLWSQWVCWEGFMSLLKIHRNQVCWVGCLILASHSGCACTTRKLNSARSRALRWATTTTTMQSYPCFP